MNNSATRFVVTGTQRTGTTLIRKTLDAHPDVVCLGEVFLFKSGLDGGVEGGYLRYLKQDPARKFTRHYIRRQRSIYAYLDQLESNRGGSRAIGFKLMLDQVNKFPSVAKYIRENHFKVIQVARRNPLKTLVSRINLQNLKIAHSTQRIDTKKIVVPTKGLVERLIRIQREALWANNLFPELRAIDVWYEDFVKNKDEQLARLLEFIDVKADQQLESGLVKINPDSLVEIIENYDSVARVLKRTDYQQYLSK